MRRWESKNLIVFFCTQKLEKTVFQNDNQFFKKNFINFDKSVKEELQMKENEIRVLQVEPHEHPKECILENTLEALQEAVDGYIDIIGWEDDICILWNDEGKLIGLEGNKSLGDDILGVPERSLAAKPFLRSKNTDQETFISVAVMQKETWLHWLMKK